MVGVNEDSLKVLDSKHEHYSVIMLAYEKEKSRSDLEFSYCVRSCSTREKFEFLVELSRIYQRNTLRCMIRNDFNIIRKSSEKNKLNTHGHWSFVFNAIIEHARPGELPWPTRIIPG